MQQKIDNISVTITNCNNIDRADITIVKDRLNIKYGPNGLGKSTIAKAIVGQILGNETLKALTPFKNRGKSGAPRICKENIAKLTDPIVKAIYLRRQYEVLDDAGFEYNLLASLFKKRATPTLKTKIEKREMTVEEKATAQTKIRQDIADFDYDDLVKQANDAKLMKEKYFATDIGYEKIQLFRIINDEHDNDVIRKFINQSYHIENEYVMQLNPHKFESVPEYVITECNRSLGAP